MSSVRREPTLPSRVTALEQSHVVAGDAISGRPIPAGKQQSIRNLLRDAYELAEHADTAAGNADVAQARTAIAVLRTLRLWARPRLTWSLQAVLGLDARGRRACLHTLLADS